MGTLFFKMGKSKKKGKKSKNKDGGGGGGGGGNDGDDKIQHGIAKADAEIRADKTRQGKLEEFYEVGEKLQIGGGESDTYLVTCKKTKDVWAARVLNKNRIEDVDALKREIEIMRKVRHANCLQLREVLEDEGRFVLVTEVASGGELFEKIVSLGPYSEADAAWAIKQVVQGVDYLHSIGIAHRDLKPENLLVAGENEDEIKICDFGLSKGFEGTQGLLKTSCGTPDYVAPEVLRGDEYDKQVDLWSVGVIAYILLCGFAPFWSNTQAELFDRILSAQVDFPEEDFSNVSQEAKDFILALLKKDPKERMSSSECLAHAWLKDAKKTSLAGGSGGSDANTSVVENLKDYAEKRKQNA